MGKITEEIPAEETEEIESDLGEETEPEPEEADDQETDEDEDVVTIGDEKEDEEAADMAPQWVRDLRKNHRKMKQRNRELEQELEQFKGSSLPSDPGPKPTLEGCDYDSDQYEQKLSNWFDAKAKHSEAKANQEREQRRQQEAYQERINAYQEKKKNLKVRDYEDAESIVEDTLSIAQQNIIIEGAENPALLVYALGKNPKRAKQLAEIKNHVRFAFEVAKLEKELKVGKRKPKTTPEKSISNTGTLSGTTDRTLERLREEAARTGDMSKVMAYRRKKKAAAG